MACGIYKDGSLGFKTFPGLAQQLLSGLCDTVVSLDDSCSITDRMPNGQPSCGAQLVVNLMLVMIRFLLWALST